MFVSEIARLHDRTTAGIFLAIRRLKIEALLFKGKRLYSPEQADFILSHMTKRPERQPRNSGRSCHPR